MARHCHFERSALAQSEKSIEFKMKNPYFKMQIRTLNSWILRFLAKAQYDKDFEILHFAMQSFSMTRQVNMTK